MARFGEQPNFARIQAEKSGRPTTGDLEEFHQRLAQQRLAEQFRSKNIRLLSDWYRVLAVINAFGAIVVVLLSVKVAFDHPVIGLVSALSALVYAVISTVTLLAFAEGLMLAVNVESHLRQIRDLLASSNSES